MSLQVKQIEWKVNSNNDVVGFFHELDFSIRPASEEEQIYKHYMFATNYGTGKITASIHKTLEEAKEYAQYSCYQWIIDTYFEPVPTRTLLFEKFKQTNALSLCNP